ncbi:unnamed protein product [Amoebophrya sp. A25]|nr:unnamed protein product [Amoebophrya sp. A25]|eukprot:GSA25T00023103001.1
MLSEKVIVSPAVAAGPRGPDVLHISSTTRASTREKPSNLRQPSYQRSSRRTSGSRPSTSGDPVLAGQHNRQNPQRDSLTLSLSTATSCEERETEGEFLERAEEAIDIGTGCTSTVVASGITTSSTSIRRTSDAPRFQRELRQTIHDVATTGVEDTADDKINSSEVLLPPRASVQAFAGTRIRHSDAPWSQRSSEVGVGGAGAGSYGVVVGEQVKTTKRRLSPNFFTEGNGFDEGEIIINENSTTPVFNLDEDPLARTSGSGPRQLELDVKAEEEDESDDEERQRRAQIIEEIENSYAQHCKREQVVAEHSDTEEQEGVVRETQLQNTDELLLKAPLPQDQLELHANANHLDSASGSRPNYMPDAHEQQPQSSASCVLVQHQDQVEHENEHKNIIKDADRPPLDIAELEANSTVDELWTLLFQNYAWIRRVRESLRKSTKGAEKLRLELEYLSNKAEFDERSAALAARLSGVNVDLRGTGSVNGGDASCSVLLDNIFPQHDGERLSSIFGGSPISTRRDQDHVDGDTSTLMLSTGTGSPRHHHHVNFSSSTGSSSRHRSRSQTVGNKGRSGSSSARKRNNSASAFRSSMLDAHGLQKTGADVNLMSRNASSASAASSRRSGSRSRVCSLTRTPKTTQRRVCVDVDHDHSETETEKENMMTHNYSSSSSGSAEHVAKVVNRLYNGGRTATSTTSKTASSKTTPNSKTTHNFLKSRSPSKSSINYMGSLGMNTSFSSNMASSSTIMNTSAPASASTAKLAEMRCRLTGFLETLEKQQTILEMDLSKIQEDTVQIELLVAKKRKVEEPDDGRASILCVDSATREDTSKPSTTNAVLEFQEGHLLQPQQLRAPLGTGMGVIGNMLPYSSTSSSQQWTRAQDRDLDASFNLRSTYTGANEASAKSPSSTPSAGIKLASDLGTKMHGLISGAVSREIVRLSREEERYPSRAPAIPSRPRRNSTERLFDGVQAYKKDKNSGASRVVDLVQQEEMSPKPNSMTVSRTSTSGVQHDNSSIGPPAPTSSSSSRVFSRSPDAVLRRGFKFEGRNSNFCPPKAPALALRGQAPSRNTRDVHQESEEMKPQGGRGAKPECTDPSISSRSTPVGYSTTFNSNTNMANTNSNANTSSANNISSMKKAYKVQLVNRPGSSRSRSRSAMTKAVATPTANQSHVVVSPHYITATTTTSPSTFSYHAPLRSSSCKNLTSSTRTVRAVAGGSGPMTGCSTVYASPPSGSISAYAGSSMKSGSLSTASTRMKSPTSSALQQQLFASSRPPAPQLPSPSDIVVGSTQGQQLQGPTNSAVISPLEAKQLIFTSTPVDESSAAATVTGVNTDARNYNSFRPRTSSAMPATSSAAVRRALSQTPPCATSSFRTLATHQLSSPIRVPGLQLQLPASPLVLHLLGPSPNTASFTTQQEPPAHPQQLQLPSQKTLMTSPQQPHAHQQRVIMSSSSADSVPTGRSTPTNSAVEKVFLPIPRLSPDLFRLQTSAKPFRSASLGPPRSRTDSREQRGRVYPGAAAHVRFADEQPNTIKMVEPRPTTEDAPGISSRARSQDRSCTALQLNQPRGDVVSATSSSVALLGNRPRSRVASRTRGASSSTSSTVVTTGSTNTATASSSSMNTNRLEGNNINKGRGRLEGRPPRPNKPRKSLTRQERSQKLTLAKDVLGKSR